MGLLVLRAHGAAAGARCTAPSLVQLRTGSVGTSESLNEDYEEGATWGAEKTTLLLDTKAKKWAWPWSPSSSPQQREFHSKTGAKPSSAPGGGSVARDPNRPYFCVEDGVDSAVEGAIQYLLTPWLFKEVEQRINESRINTTANGSTNASNDCMCPVRFPYCYPDDSICYKSNISREYTNTACASNCTRDFDANLSSATSTPRTLVNTQESSVMCMAVAGSGYDEGDNITARSCDGSATMRWTWHSKQLVNARSFLCLDSTNASSITQQTCSNESAPSQSQEWMKVSKQLYHGKTGLCITLNSSVLALKVCANAPDQQWLEIPASGANLLGVVSHHVLSASVGSSSFLRALLVGRSLLATADIVADVLELLRRPTFADAVASVNLTQNLTNRSRDMVTNETFTTLQTLIRNECSTTTTTTTTTTTMSTTTGSSTTTTATTPLNNATDNASAANASAANATATPLPR